MSRYSPTDRALARLSRQMDAVAVPTQDERDAAVERARLRIAVRARAAAGRPTPLTAAEAAAMDAEETDNAGWMAYRRAAGLPTDDAYVARQKADLTARLRAARDHEQEVPRP